ncbi:MAG: hypothetical protein PHH26_00305 [Candidatus Thermoplasmatota archaeon]|nr:hypothetical protein [Candidatus Thermoplasmatota archaeon]
MPTYALPCGNKVDDARGSVQHESTDPSKKVPSAFCPKCGKWEEATLVVGA